MSEKMSIRILILPYSHTLSHISRPLAVAKELRERGHEVVFAGESPKTTFIRQEGFNVLPLHEPEPDELFGNIRKGKLRFISDAEVERMIEADVALYRKVQPDFVLTDGRFTAPISTHIAGLAHAAIVNVSSTEYRALPYIPFFDWWIPEWLIKRDAGLWKMFDLFNLKLEMFVFDNVMCIFKKLSKKYGIKKTVTATNCLTGKDITLLADIPEYFPARNLPENYHYIGPITWQSNMAPPAWWPPQVRDKLIYVTMGTTGLGDFFRLAYDLFKNGQYTCVMTTGKQSEPMSTVPGNIYIEEYIDGDLVMEVCDAVVCHFGNGSVCQGLYHGKPIIGIPTIPDQSYNMRRVEALGVGKSLAWKEFYSNPKILLAAINAVLTNPCFAENARRMQSILKTYQPAKTAADIIERYISTETPCQ